MNSVTIVRNSSVEADVLAPNFNRTCSNNAAPVRAVMAGPKGFGEEHVGASLCDSSGWTDSAQTRQGADVFGSESLPVLPPALDYAGAGVEALIVQLDRTPAEAKAVAEAASAAKAQSGAGEAAGAGAVLFWIILILFFVNMFARRRRGGRRSGIDPGIVLWGVSEILHHMSDGRGGGGGFGGGGGGGGFGGFGGGMSGGGGASGSW